MDCIEGVLEEFRGLSQFPHASHHEDAVGGYLMERLRRMGLSPVRDAAGNIMADVSAAPGHEAAPLVILQGHMDMVVAVKPLSAFDPLRDSVNIMVEDGLLKTDGNSSLGADNNLGNAVVLWLLGQELGHGPLRLLFTVAEEVGLQGAGKVDPAWLSGAKYLINTDGFHLGTAIVSSAGGRRETFCRVLDTAPTKGVRAYQITFSGYPGGHSGDDIDKKRPNPIKLLCERLGRLTGDWELAGFAGGTGHNVIPTWAEAVVVLPQGAQPGADMTPIDLPARVWTAPCRSALLGLLEGVYNGVYAWHTEFPGVVASSANLGKVEAVDGRIEVSTFIRCTRVDHERLLAGRHANLAQWHGFSTVANGYPGWQGDARNPLALLMAEVYRARTGREMRIFAVHVGLEPSFFQEKAPGLIMVSTGPDILDAHSVDERAPLDSLPPYAQLLAGTLEELG